MHGGGVSCPVCTPDPRKLTIQLSHTSKKALGVGPAAKHKESSRVEGRSTFEFAKLSDSR